MDGNDYALGRIGKLNVVIAVSPDGEYGMASAAITARDMLHSFPNIRTSLMVGIGGGAPSEKHDIRLGDIVVGATYGKESGVLQYDFKTTIQNQSFQHVHFLKQPPITLRFAMISLGCNYELDGHHLNEAIDSILEKHPRLSRHYQRPELKTDKLFMANATHNSSCAVVCGDDPSNLILRPERWLKDEPEIHYGNIASGKQLMKDALLRDKLAAENDILCFEMEAAGLMDYFPCLIIRGICDYSDSHKNKEWQGYAAIAAAAYTKDLLYRINPDRIEGEEKISNILSGNSTLKVISLIYTNPTQSSKKLQTTIFKPRKSVTNSSILQLVTGRTSGINSKWKKGLKAPACGSSSTSISAYGYDRSPASC